MAGDLAEPLDAGVLQLDTRVEALGDGVGNGDGAVLAQGGDELLLLANQRIDFRGLLVQELVICRCSSTGGRGNLDRRCRPGLAGSWCRHMPAR